MGITKRSDITPGVIAPGRTRYLAHCQDLMVTVVDFNDGPAEKPDPPHSHPHQQVSYVASGELLLVLGDETVHLKPGDLFTVPSNLPHAVQALTPHVRIIDAFTPIREDFLK
jgi:quercetin dioxygenase-like cupin family protein